MNTTPYNTMDIPLEANIARTRTSPAALQTPEILENVLHFLPQKNIINCERVCKFFGAVIKNSIILKRDLFIVPVAAQHPVPPIALPADVPKETIAEVEDETGDMENPSVEDEAEQPFIELNAFLVSAAKDWKICQRYEVNNRHEEEVISLCLDFNKTKLQASPELSQMVLARPLIPLRLSFWWLEVGPECWHEEDLELWCEDLKVANDVLTMADLMEAGRRGLGEIESIFEGYPDTFTRLVKLEDMQWRLTFPVDTYRFRINGEEWSVPDSKERFEMRMQEA